MIKTNSAHQILKCITGYHNTQIKLLAQYQTYIIWCYDLRGKILNTASYYLQHRVLFETRVV